MTKAERERVVGSERDRSREHDERVRAEERERCARVCESMADDHEVFGRHASQALVTAAQSIRALGSRS